MLGSCNAQITHILSRLFIAEKLGCLDELLVLQLHALELRYPAPLSFRIQIIVDDSCPSLFVFGELDGSHLRLSQVGIILVLGEPELMWLLQPHYVL